MNRRFRLTRSTDVKRVRRYGISYAHPLLVLIAMPDTAGELRFGVLAGRSVGTAVQRNRAKRLIREALRPLLPHISPGWKVILLSRRSTPNAKMQDVQAALLGLLRRADLLKDANGN